MARVAFEHVSKTFRGPKGEIIRAVDDASFAVEDKELLVLVGPSGCGKTTTLRLIAGLEEISSGTIAIDGTVVNKVPPENRDVAMVFQHHALYPHMSALENLAFGLKVRKVAAPEIERRIKETSEILDLSDTLSRRPEELSGGQRQRVALGRALVLRPRLFLFDEPLSNLDVQMRAQLRTEIARLHSRLGATMIYVTHDQTEAMTLGDRVAVLRDGKIQQIAEPMHVYRQPANLFVAGFIGSPPMNLFPGTITRNAEGLFFEQTADDKTANGAPFSLKLDSAATARLQGQTGRQIILGLRPEDIAVRSAASPPHAGSAVDALVEVVEPLGPETHVHLRHAGRVFVVRAPALARPQVNDRVALAFDMSKASFFDPVAGNALSLPLD